MWACPAVATARNGGNVMRYGRPSLIARLLATGEQYVTNWIWVSQPNLIWGVALYPDDTYQCFPLGLRAGLRFPYGLAVTPP